MGDCFMFSSILSKVAKNVSDWYELFLVFQEGTSVFPTGQHVIQIKTRSEPKQVWLRLVEEGEMAVCQGGLTQMSYTMTPTGFILYADVPTDTAQIDWVVYF
jgi:hypothetical protein